MWLKPMTHSPDFGAETRRRSAPKIGADFWYEKSAPKINRKNTQPTGAGRSRPAPVGMTHSPENRRRFSAPSFGAEIWTVCHRLKFNVFCLICSLLLFGHGFLGWDFTDQQEVCQQTSPISLTGLLKFWGQYPQGWRNCGLLKTTPSRLLGAPYKGICFLLRHLFLLHFLF